MILMWIFGEFRSILFRPYDVWVEELFFFHYSCSSREKGFPLYPFLFLEGCDWKKHYSKHIRLIFSFFIIFSLVYWPKIRNLNQWIRLWCRVARCKQRFHPGAYSHWAIVMIILIQTPLLIKTMRLIVNFFLTKSAYYNHLDQFFIYLDFSLLLEF